MPSTSDYPADMASALAVVSLEDQRPKLETFTLFPELAPELRSKIWRHCFPAGGVLRLFVSLYFGVEDAYVGGRWDCENGINCCDACLNSDTVVEGCALANDEHRRPSDIITLRINSESRRETLKYYQALFLGPTPGKLYFLPDSDAVEFVVDGWSPRYTIYMLASFAEVTSWYPACNLDKIQHLIINQMYWDKDMKKYLKGDFAGLPALVSNQRARTLKKDLAHYGLMSFHGLKELTFVAEEYYEGLELHHAFHDLIESEEKAQEFKNAVVKFFEKEKKLFPDCNIPTVNVRYAPPTQKEILQ